MIPTIFLDKEPEWSSDIPRVRINENEKWIKHVHCEGSRFHVLAYIGRENHLRSWCETRCSEPDCIYNKPTEDNL